MSLSRVITNELLHCRKRTPSLRGEVLGADTTGTTVARVGTAAIAVEDMLYTALLDMSETLCLDNCEKSSYVYTAVAGAPQHYPAPILSGRVASPVSSFRPYQTPPPVARHS